MNFTAFEFTRLFAPGLPPAAARWSGRVKFDFTGGNNDPERVPLEGLIAAAESVLRREGRRLAIYGVDNGPQGYRPLRDFLVGKLKADAGITCTADGKAGTRSSGPPEPPTRRTGLRSSSPTHPATVRKVIRAR